MRRQVRRVLSTYLSRPLTWLLGVGYLNLLFILGAWIAGESNSYTRCSPQFEPAGRTLRSLADWEAALQNEQQADVVSIRLEYIINDVRLHGNSLNRTRSAGSEAGIEHVADLFAGLRQFPNLQRLSLTDYRLSNNALRQLTHLRNLQMLSLSGTRIGPDDLQYLSKLRNLEVLDLTQCEVAGGLHHLSELPRLQTLIANSFEGVNDAFIADLSHLPHLRTLVMDATIAQDGQRFVTPAGLLPLGQHPSLRVVYIGPYPLRIAVEFPSELTHGHTVPAFSEPAQALRAVLPDLDIRRSAYVRSRIQIFNMLLIADGLTVMLLVLHLIGQFSLPAARLMPNYRNPHLAVPAGVLLLLLGFNGLVLWQTGSTFGAAFGTPWIAMMLAIAVLFCLFVPRHQLNPTGWQTVLGVLGALLLPLKIVFSDSLDPWIDAWLLGDYPAVMGLIAMVSGLALPWSIVSLRRLCVESNELDVEPGLTFSDNRRALERAATRKRADREPRMWRGAWKPLEAICERGFHQNRLGHRLALWRAGTGINRRNLFVALMMLLAYVQFDAFRQLQQAGTWHWAELWRPQAFFGVTLFLFCIPVVSVPFIWRQRRPMFRRESLLPLSRATFRRDIALAIACDTLAVVPIAAFFLLAGLLLTESLQDARGRWLAAGLLATVGGLLALYAILFWTIIVRRNWVALFIAFVTYFGFVAIIAAIGLAGLAWTPRTLMLIGGGLGTAGAILTAVVYRWWMHAELG